MEVCKQPIKPRLSGKKYKAIKLNMTQHGYNTDVDSMALALNDEKREEQRLVANQNGQCTNIHGQIVLQGLSLKDQWEVNQENKHSKFIWTMDDSGNVYIGLSDNSGGLFHSTLMGGYRPVAAGEICIVDGYIVYLNEESGHYAPQGRLQTVVAELKEQGFKFPKITLENCQHDAVVKRIDKLDVRKQLITRNKLASGLKTEKWLNT